MPISIVPVKVKISNDPLNVKEGERQGEEQILEATERIIKQLEQITNLELESGDI